ncbi:mCG127445, isoform CRA_a, partial [Mus musculus]
GRLPTVRAPPPGSSPSRAWKASSLGVHTVRTGKVFKSNIQLQGDPLFYAFPNTFVLKNVCKADISVYLGQKVFLTIDNFESSLLPLTVPKSLAVDIPSSAAPKNYMQRKPWGISEPVSHISGDVCCFKGSFCLELSNNLFAYLRGGQIPGTNIYFSDNGGFSFQLMNTDKLSHLTGTLGGIFHLHSMSQVGVLMVENN